MNQRGGLTWALAPDLPHDSVACPRRYGRDRCLHFKWANRVFTHILIGLIVPMQMTLVPLTLLMNALNLNAEMIYLHTDRNRPIRVYHAVDQRFILEDFFAKLAWWYRKTP